MKQLLFITIINILIIINASAQCFTADESIWLDPWQSCTTTINPNSERGMSHWLQYDLGAIYTLSKAWAWNSNDPDLLGTGMKDVSIDYSMDGIAWSHLGDYTFERATGEAVYGGFPAFDFDGLQARYILITAHNSWDDGDCVALSEVKFNLLHDGFQNIDQSENKTFCPAPSFIQTSPVTATSSIVIFDHIASTDRFTMRYRPLGTEDWTSLVVGENPYFLQGLSPETEYEIEVQIQCGDAMSNWSQTFTFKTFEEQLSCGLPLYSSSLVFSATEIAVAWNFVPEASMYNVRYRVIGEPEWSEVSTTEVFAFLPDLKPFQTYEYQIESICAGLPTGFSESLFFNSSLENTYEPMMVQEPVVTNTPELNPIAAGIKIFPNPATIETYVNYKSNINDMVRVELIDLQGKVVYKNVFNAASGNNNFTINTELLSGGIYQVHVFSMTQRTTQTAKLLKI